MSATTTSHPISRLGDLDEAAVPADVTRLIQACHQDNWIRTLALNPDSARRFFAYSRNLFDPRRGLLMPAERELIALVVSVTNGCGLCEIHHERSLAEASGDPVRARKIALDHHLVEFSARERALVDLAVKVTQDPKSVTAADLQSLRDTGLDDRHVLEAIETIAWFNHSNRIFIALGVVPEDRYFG